MATPILENIAAEIVTRLALITTGNGYEFTAESVTRVKRHANEWTPRHLAIVVDQDEETENEDLSYPGNPPATAFDATFNIHGFVRVSDRATTASDIEVNQMLAAIKKAVTAATNWHQFDGNAINANWGTAKPWDSGEGDHDGVTVPLIVLYRVSETDPFAVRA